MRSVPRAVATGSPLIASIENSRIATRSLPPSVLTPQQSLCKLRHHPFSIQLSNHKQKTRERIAGFCLVLRAKSVVAVAIAVLAVAVVRRWLVWLFDLLWLLRRTVVVAPLLSQRSRCPGRQHRPNHQCHYNSLHFFHNFLP